MTVEEEGFARLELSLFPFRASHVSGRLLDRETLEPVQGAEVWIRGGDARTLTDQRGHFELGDVLPGTYMPCS